MNDRLTWLRTLERIVRPVLTAASRRELKKSLPVHVDVGQPREHGWAFIHYEAVSRTLTGLAPWLELDDVPRDEAALQSEFRELARKTIAAIVDPDSPDLVDFAAGIQGIVECAFLAHAFLRAPKQLWHLSDATTRRRVADAFISMRDRIASFNNWLLFTAITETMLHTFGKPYDPLRVDYGVRQHEQWYVGGGIYKDGPSFHLDYYNSFVIHPMLLDVVEHFAPNPPYIPAMPGLLETVRARAARYAELLERLISPDGSFPAIGRSMAYRCGAFQLLAHLAVKHALPQSLPPGQVRSALSAVIHRTMDAPQTFDADGWLQIGLCGHQPSLAESYIATGSLYLCTAAFLPLGLPASDPFWTEPATMFTQQKLWSGQDVSRDYDPPAVAR